MKILLGALGILLIFAAIIFGGWAGRLSRDNTDLRFKLNRALSGCLTTIDSSVPQPNNNWLGQPPPTPRLNLSHDYWQVWCGGMYGRPKAGPHFRQDAEDWSDHCTEAGDAKQ
jgi:hypothetical protein